MTTLRHLILAACLLLLTSSSLLTLAFTVGTSAAHVSLSAAPSSSIIRADALSATPASLLLESASSHLQAAATVDPTAALSNILGNFLASPAILAIPIVAALGVASLLAFLIYAYAQPAAADDDDDEF